MYIYNTTFLVSDRIHNTWLNWINEVHIPLMQNSGIFVKPQLAKVMIAEGQQDGTSFSVQFHFSEIDAFNTWNEQFSDDFQRDITNRFGTEVLAFSTILEVI